MLLREYYADKTVLLTGATGLLGKLLVEKFLRDLPDIRRLYLLMRPAAHRDGQLRPVSERLAAEVVGSSLFDALRARLDGRFDRHLNSRIELIEGHVDAPDLGLAPDTRARLLAEVDIIVNAAAAVSFDGPLDIAVRTNTYGPQHLLELARASQHRAILAHTSTCYVSGCRSGPIPEEPLDPRWAPRASGKEYDVSVELQRLARLIEQETRAAHGDPEQLRRKLIELGVRRARYWGWNDVYTFTKAMGEQLLVREAGAVPLVIVRPSIIESTLAQPVPGWIDNLRMADPVVVAYGRYQLPDFPASAEHPVDFVPADLVVNALLAAVPTAHTGGQPAVYQVASGAANPITPREFIWYLREGFDHESLNGRPRTRAFPVFQFPSLPEFQRRLMYGQILPGRIMQSAGELARGTRWGQELAERGRRRRLAAQRLWSLAGLLGPYSTQVCEYDSRRVRQLWQQLAPADREDFGFDIESIDWRHYFRKVHIPGLRRYVLKQSRNSPNGQTDRPAAAWGRGTPRVVRAVAEPWPDANLLERAAQAVTRAVFGTILRTYIGLEVEGLEHVPAHDPFIAVSSHNSHIDAAALMVLLGRAGRQVHPVAAADYFFSTPLRARLSRTFLSAVPFSRTTPAPPSLALAVNLLRRGHSLIFFPEGGRSSSDRLREFKRGVGLVALASGVPVVPVRVTGSYYALPKGAYWPQRHRVRVRFGPAIRSLDYLELDTPDPARRLTDDLRAAVEQLD